MTSLSLLSHVNTSFPFAVFAYTMAPCFSLLKVFLFEENTTLGSSGTIFFNFDYCRLRSSISDKQMKQGRLHHHHFHHRCPPFHCKYPQDLSGLHQKYFIRTHHFRIFYSVCKPCTQLKYVLCHPREGRNSSIFYQISGPNDQHAAL